MSDNLEEVRKTLAKVEDIDPGDVEMPPQDPGAPAPPCGAGDSSDPPEKDCSAYPLNDYGNGKRFARHFGEDAIFVGRVGWHVWDGCRWRCDDEIAKGLSPEVRAKAQKMGELIAAETAWLRPSKKEKALMVESARLAKRRIDLEEDPSKAVEGGAETEIATIDARVKAIEALLKDHTSLIGRRLTHAKNAGNSGPLSNMLGEAQVMLSRSIEDMDADPLVVNTESGTLRFSTYVDEHDEAWSAEGASPPKRSKVEFFPHQREQLLTKMMGVAYDPAAIAPRFEAFIEQIQPIPEMRRFLQRWYGLSMTALTGEQKLVFEHGTGGNGKSVLNDVLARLLSDYAATAKIESLTGRNKRGGGDATPDLMPLIGARMVRSSEPEEGERVQEGMIKELTGGEPIMVRALHSDFVTVYPKFKLTISGNHKPDIRGTDDGIWRRLLLVPFSVQIPEEQRDLEMVDKLLTEGPGILNWMIEGLLDYLANGLQEPDMVLEATKKFRQESDPVGAFLTDCTAVTGHEGDFITSKTLIDAFNFWMDEKGETKWGGRTVSLKLKDKADSWRDPVTQRTFIAGKSGVTGYRGIRLKEIFEKRFDVRNSSSSAGEDRSWPDF